MKRFDEHAEALAKRQYLQEGDGDILGMFRRVARAIAEVESPEERKVWEERFYELMSTGRFSPGGRILAGAGTLHGNLLNCFVQGATENPPESFEGIMEVAKKLALVTKVGGGNGVNLDPYRRKKARPLRKVVGFAYMRADHKDVEDFILGLMRPSRNPDGEKEPHPLRNWVRVVYGELPPELRKLAEEHGVHTVMSPPKDLIVIPDDLAGIMDALKEAMRVAKGGESPRVDFSLLRPEGSPIKGSGGTSSGPVSFLVELFDNFLEWVNLGAETAGPVATLRYVYAPVLRSIRQGGVRRGAGMATLSVDHEDILDFITAKDLDRERSEGDISTFNISVLATEEFLRKVEHDELMEVPHPVEGKYVLEELLTPYQGEWPEVSSLDPSLRPIPIFRGEDGRKGVPARWLFREIAWHAWATGEPGLIFIDRVNEMSALKGLGEPFLIKSTNPCGEIPLTTGEPCDLGAFNLEAYVRDGAFDFEAFKRDIPIAVRFLDNVLTVNRFALKDNEEAAKKLRRLGLGVMGFADMLIRLGLPYGSKEARSFAEKVMTVLREEAEKASEELAKERGPFPLYKEHEEYFRSLGIPPRRNVALLTVAPTGTTSMIMGVSSGIEPVFAPFVWRKIGGEYKPLIHLLFKELLSQYPPHPEYEKNGEWDWDKVVERVQENHGSLQGLAFIPLEVQKVFQCAHDIHPLDHVRMQGVIQRAFDDGKYVGNSLSKCIAKGTLIPTSRGLIPIEEIAPPHPEDTFVPVENLYTAEGFRISAHYFGGKKRGVKVLLDNGAELVGAWDSHRVLTPEGWKLMRELKPGDLVLGKLVPSHGPGGLPIPESSLFPPRTNARALRLPERMSEELALLLGMLAADGSTIESPGFVGIFTKDPEVERVFREVVSTLFGIEPKSTVDKRTGVKTLYLTSRLLVRFVEALIGKGAAQKGVPSQILQGSSEEKLAFLRGLTLDGYLAKGLGLVVYEGKSKRLAYEAAELARSFGLPKVYQGRKKVSSPRETYHVHSVVVSGPLQELIEPIEAHKRGKVKSRYKVFVPQDLVSSTHVGAYHSGYTNLKSVRRRGANVVFGTTADRLGWPTEILAYRVVEVEEVGEVEMYDIEVEEVHRYVVNGIISHNTINLPHSATVEDVVAAYWEAYKTGCKGITVYRDGSREEQVLMVRKTAENTQGEDQGTRSRDRGKKVESTSQSATAPSRVLPHKGNPTGEHQAASRSQGGVPGREHREDVPSEPHVASWREHQTAPKGPVFEREGRLYGFTDMVKLFAQDGTKRSFLVTVNLKDGHPVEVILTSGKAGDEANADSEALGRVVSIALQYGVPKEALIKTLRGINGGLYGTYHGRLVASKADLIAVALETAKGVSGPTTPPIVEHPEGEKENLGVSLPISGGAPQYSPAGTEHGEEPGVSLAGANIAVFPLGSNCPVCGEKTLVREEGCFVCKACGYSKCG